ncbi:ankyrin repeat-containing protein [Desulfomonile tiedjei DSM 6799]|uniref:Ankyrin repeat-containing protein n=1 Tax=Desulfomonile tiedjei (strain ATCC 49306 / DSM 6799 / DCB-1) TaxID=706587 RepID=I4CES1_DESTA|nr:ankyrin repeat-containing protein [Desulfomonile tiedjei DSM 6799]
MDSTERGGIDRTHWGFSQSETKKHLVQQRTISNNLVRYEIRDFEPQPESTLSFMFTQRQPGRSGDINDLTHAAMNGRVEQVKKLLDKGVDVNSRSNSGETPLMAAAWGGHVAVAKLLLEKGADVNAETGNGRNALVKAMENAWMRGREQIAMAKLLIEHGAKPTNLAVAAFVGDLEAIQHFTANGLNTDEKGTLNKPAPLTAAAMGGQMEAITLLLDKGVHKDAKNEQGQTSLMAAAAAGHADVVKLLLDRGAHINEIDVHRRNALNHAVFLRGHVEVVRVLLDRGADINSRDNPANRTILMHAAQSGNLALVNLLLEKGAEVNARDGNGKTALSLARGKDIEEIEKVLIEHGAKK